MIKIYYGDKLQINDVLNREIFSYGEYESVVRDILQAVRNDGDSALIGFAEKFDGVKLSSLEVSEDEITEAFLLVDEKFQDVLKRASQNITAFHKMQVRDGFSLNKGEGIVLGQKISPIESIGVYVPGGTASYPSTVLMNVIPAKLAGVSQIIMTTPPMKDGKIQAEILVAARLSGVDRIFKCGGAGAIAGLAYGTQTIPRVNKIVGPGNIYVALAKKEVFGTVGIDMVAGPSEILIISDGSASAKCVAADLLSQAEHDILASSVLITTCERSAKAVQEEIEVQLKELSRQEIARASIESNGKIIVVDNLEMAAEISNKIAPEHLELCVEDPFELMEKIKNAGSIFLGNYTPEAVGDYYAGPNHTLPTSGSAKFSSPLSVDDFVKKSSFIYYPKEELKKVSEDIVEFASREGLDAHAKSISKRF